jgi:geranylgeranyl diphosphate synthase type I
VILLKPVNHQVMIYAEGKRTVLMAIATEGADKAQREIFEKYVGNPDLTADQISQLQEAIMKTGAVD